MERPATAPGWIGDGVLSAELRRTLGLGNEECVRLLSAGPRTLVLERSSTPPGAPHPLPRERELTLVADVRTFPLADVLGMVHATGGSGLLFFMHGDHAKSVYLHHGEVVFAASNQRVDRLGECLVRAGVISMDQLREAERRFTPPERFGKVLVERNYVTPRELWHGVKYQVEEIVRSLFSYTEGTVCFWSGDIQPDNVVRLSLPTRRLVSEGVQRRDELLRFLACLEDPRVRVEAVAGRESSLAGEERELWDTLHTEPTFPGLCQRLGGDALATARSLQLLRLVGAVRLQRVREAEGYVGEADLQRHFEEMVRELVVDHLKLLEALLEPLAAVAGRDPLRERLGRVVEELGDRFPDLLRGIGPSGPDWLDTEALVARAVRLGERDQAQVRAALGELIAYGEFELKNHPAIEDADRHLRALEPLRARLHL